MGDVEAVGKALVDAFAEDEGAPETLRDALEPLGHIDCVAYHRRF
jgi:hypothetical protein